MNSKINRVGSLSTAAANARKGGFTSLAMIAAAGAAASIGGVAAAQQSVWNLDAAGTWDTIINNWRTNGAGAPTTFITSNTAVFGPINTAARSIAVASGGVNAAGLSFNNWASRTYTVGSAGNSITLNSGGASDTIAVGSRFVGPTSFTTGGNTISGSLLRFTNNLQVNNNAAFGSLGLSITGGIDRVSGAGSLTVDGSGNTSIVTATGAVMGAGINGIVKNGSGTLTLSGSGTSLNTGGFTVNGGVLSIATTSDTAIGGGNFTINNGGAIRYASTPSATTRTHTFSGNSTLDLNNTTAVVFGTAGQLASSGSTTLNVAGTNTGGILSIENNNNASFTGAINVGGPQLVGNLYAPRVFSPTAGPTLRLQGAGTLTGASSLTLNNGSALLITQSTTPTTGRLGTVPITSNSGRFQYNTAAATGGITDTFGTLTMTGQTTISGSSALGSTSGTTVTFAGITRNDNATLMLRGPATGSGSIGGAPGTGIRYLVTGMTDSGGSGLTRNVVPWAGSVGSVTGTDYAGLITYDANGFRPLAVTELAAVTSLANFTAAAGQNVNVQSSLALTASQNILSWSNSTGTPTITGAGTITITNTSGAWQNFNTTVFNGPVLNNPNGAYFHLGFPVTLQGTSALTGAGGVTATALNTSTNYQLRLTNTVANTFTGGLFANGNAQVVFTANNQLGNDGSGNAAGNITLGGGQLIFLPASATTVSLNDGANNRNISVNASNGTIGTGFGGATLQIPGTISGSGQVQFGGGASSSATGVVELTNASANTYTGGTLVSTGVLRLSNSNQLGTGSVFLNGGTLQSANNSLSFSAAPTVLASSTIDAGTGNSVTLAGGLNGLNSSHTLTKSGAGALNITGASNYSGAVTVSGGSLNLSGSGAMTNLGAVSLATGTSFTINETAGANADRIGPATNITLGGNGSSLVLTAPSGGGANLQFGTLTLSGSSNTSSVQIVDGGTGINTYSFLSLGTVASGNSLQFLGTTNLGLATAGGTRIFFNTAPTLTSGVIPNVSFTGFNGTAVSATYDPVLGLLAYLQTPGAFIDNFNNVGVGSITPNNTNFLSNGAVTANLGAGVNSLTLAGHTLTLVPNVYATPSVTNRNAAADTLIIGNGSLTLTTASAAISGSGRIQFGDSGTLVAGIDVASGQTLTVNAGSTLATTGGLNKTSAGILTINGTNSITGAYNIAAGTANLNTGGTTSGLTTAASTTLGLGTGTLTINGAATTTAAGLLTGSTGSSLTLAAANTGTLTLSGANGASLVTAFNVNGGTLVAGNATALGAATNAVTVGSGGTLGFSGTVAVANTNPVTINGTGATGRNGAIDNISGTNSFAGPITLASNATIGATAGTLTLSGGLSGSGQPTFNVAGGAQVTLSTVALNVGTNALSKTGAGVLVLPNLANTMGGQNISGGTVQASADNNLGANTGTMNLSNGGGFRYGATFALDAARPIVLGTGGGSFDTNGFSPTYSGSMTGAGSFTKTGTGALTIATTQGYTGGTRISGGSISLGASNVLPATGLTIGADTSEAVSQLTLGAFNQSVSGLTLLAGGTGATRVAGAGTLTVNGDINLINSTDSPGNRFGGTLASTTLDLGGGVRSITVAGQNNSGPDLVISSIIQNGGITVNGLASTAVTAAASGVRLSGANTFNGGVTVNSGLLDITSTGTFGAATNVLTINATGVNSANTNSLVTINSNQTIGGLAGTVSGTATSTLSMGTFGLTVNQATNTTFGGLITGSGAFAKGGAGTLNLTGNSTHTGSITVNAGTLAINGNYAGVAAGTVTVNSGGTLSGSGTLGSSSTLVRNTTINAGGNLSPGNSPGILTINGNVTFAANSNFNVEINGFAVGNEYDRLVVNGTVTNAGNINVAFDNWAFPYPVYTGNDADPYLNDTWFILSNDGSDATAAFANAAEGATISVGTVGGIAHTAQITYFADLATGSLTGGNDVALYNLIPTPSATALIGLGTILAGRRRRQA